MAEQPRRAHEVRIVAGGDTLDDLKHVLRALLNDIDTESPEPVVPRTICGYSYGANVSVYHDPNQTHESYHEQLDDFLAEEVDDG
jgi:hypothetical protein